MKTTKLYSVVLTSKYRKSYKKMAKRGSDVRRLDRIVFRLSHGEKLESKYKDHILKGEYKGFHECHIHPDWLLIYFIEDNTVTITLVDTGTHADLFNM